MLAGPREETGFCLPPFLPYALLLCVVLSDAPVLFQTTYVFIWPLLHSAQVCQMSKNHQLVRPNQVLKSNCSQIFSTLYEWCLQISLRYSSSWQDCTRLIWSSLPTTKTENISWEDKKTREVKLFCNNLKQHCLQINMGFITSQTYIESAIWHLCSSSNSSFCGEYYKRLKCPSVESVSRTWMGIFAVSVRSFLPSV